MYEAQDLESGREYALKVIKGDKCFCGCWCVLKETGL